MSWQFSLVVSSLRWRVTPTMLLSLRTFISWIIIASSRHLLQTSLPFSFTPWLHPALTTAALFSLLSLFKCLHKTSDGPELCSPYHYQISVHRSNKSGSSEASLAPTDFKILLLTFKALHQPPPLYFSEFIHIHTLPHPQSLFCHPTHYSVSPLYYRVVFRALSHKTFIHSIDSLDLEILSQNAPYQNGIHLWFWLYRLHSHWAFLLIILYLIIIFFVLDLVICPWVLWKVPINKMSYLLSWFRESIVCLSLFISRVRVRESDFKWCFLDPLLISWRRGFTRGRRT